MYINSLALELFTFFVMNVWCFRFILNFNYLDKAYLCVEDFKKGKKLKPQSTWNWKSIRQTTILKSRRIVWKMYVLQLLLIILTYLVGRKFRWNQLYHNHKEDHCQWRYIFLRFGMDCLKHKHRKLSILLPEIVWKTSLYVVTNLVSKLCIIHSTPKRILDDPPM